METILRLAASCRRETRVMWTKREEKTRQALVVCYAMQIQVT